MLMKRFELHKPNRCYYPMQDLMKRNKNVPIKRTIARNIHQYQRTEGLSNTSNGVIGFVSFGNILFRFQTNFVLQNFQIQLIKLCQ